MENSTEPIKKSIFSLEEETVLIDTGKGKEGEQSALLMFYQSGENVAYLEFIVNLIEIPKEEEQLEFLTDILKIEIE